MCSKMAGGGINIYPGYTGVLCLYHHITKHVIVQWTGLDGVDQQAKLDTEENLLSFFKATGDVSNEDGVDSCGVDVEVVETHSQVVENVESVNAFSEVADSADANPLDTTVKIEPTIYEPTDIEVPVTPYGTDQVCTSPEMVEDTTSSAVVEDSVANNGGTRSTDDIGQGQKTETTECDKKHTCDQCSRSFVSRSALRIHMRIHTGEKPYSCTHCDKTFTQSCHLKRHMNSHTEGKHYNCTQCNKTFALHSHLKQHMANHDAEKPFHCAQCNKRFGKSGALKRHIRTHTGEKPYKCTQCGKAFARTDHRRQHMRTHGKFISNPYMGFV